jgi:hypothetical protein
MDCSGGNIMSRYSYHQITAFLIIFGMGLLSIIASGGGGGGGGGVGNVPGTLQFSATTYQVDENGTGTATISVSRTGGSDGAVSVSYATSNGSATAGSDYTASSGTLNWADGDATAQTFDVPITNDTVVELPETVNLTLSSVTGGATLGTSSAILTINSEDSYGTIQFNSNSYDVSENPSRTVTDVIILQRVNGSSGAVSVDVSDAGTGTAPGADYTFTSPTTVNWADGDTASKTVPITLVDNAIQDGTRTVDLALGNVTGGAAIGTPGTATVNIADDESATLPGQLQFDSATYSVKEDAGSITITVNRINGTSGAASVDYATSDGTATDGSDYTGASGTLNWAAGEGGAKTFTVDIINDTLVEKAETINLTLSAASGASLGTPNTATITIEIDDTNLSMNIGDGTYWVAFQDGPTGTWTDWSPSSGYTYNFPVTDADGKYGVAFHVTETDSVYSVEKTYVIQQTLSELSSLDVYQNPKYSVSGTLSNFSTGSNDSADVIMHLMGDGGDMISDPYTYNIPLVSAGNRDLIAAEYNSALGGTPDNIVVRRNINVNDNISNNVDFDSDSDVEAFTYTVNNFSGSSANQLLEVYYATDNGTVANIMSEIYDGSTPQGYIYITNSSLTQTGDAYSFQIMNSAGTKYRIRNKTATTDPGAQSLGLGSVASLTGTTVDSTHVTGLSYTPDPTSFSGSPVFRGFGIDLDQTVSGVNGGDHWAFRISDGWLGGSTNYTYPDLASINGFDSSWVLATGFTTNASVAAITSKSGTGDSYIIRKTTGRNSNNIPEPVLSQKLAQKDNASIDFAIQYSNFNW